MTSTLKTFVLLVALLAAPHLSTARSLRQDVSAVLSMNQATGEGEVVGVVEERAVTSPSRVRDVVTAVQNVSPRWCCFVTCDR